MKNWLRGGIIGIVTGIFICLLFSRVSITLSWTNLFTNSPFIIGILIGFGLIGSLIGFILEF